MNVSFLNELLSSTDKDARVRAEEAFKRAQTAQPVELCDALLQVSAGGAENNLTALALVLLRQTIKLDWTPTVGANQHAAKVAIGNKVVHMLGAVQDDGQAKKLIEVLVAIPQPTLNSFTDQVLVLLTSSAPKKALFLIDAFAEFAYSDKVSGPFCVLLTRVITGAETVGIAEQLLGVRAGVSLVLACENASQHPVVREFASLIPGNGIKTVARAVIQGGIDESQLEQTMESLVSLSDSCGWALDATLADNCSMLLDVCDNSSVPASIRSLSMTMFGSIMARKGSSASKDAAFTARTIGSILRLQIEDEDFTNDFEEDVSPDEDDILGLSQSGPRGSALDTLSQLAHGSAGNNIDASNLLVAVFTHVKPLLASPDWKARIAALSSVSVVAAPLEKAFKPFAADVIGGSSKMLLEDPNSRVRMTAAACIHALIDASKKLGKEIRKNLHGIVITSVAAALTNNESRDPCATRCALLLALGKFYGGVPRKGGAGDDTEGDHDAEDETVFVPKSAITPYLDGLVQTLVRVLQTSSQAALQVRAMETLSAIGAQAKASFGKYYNVLVPGIKAALQNAQDASVKTAAMILVATCAETVDKECFTKDAAEVVGMFLQRQHQQQLSSTKEETSELQGLFQFSERVASVLGKDFAPFLPHLLPLVCNSAKADLGISIAENVSTEHDKVEQDETSGQATAVTKLRGVGKFEISANIYAFQLRESALSLLDALAESGCLAPEHLDECVNAILPNISDRACTSGLNVAAAEAAASLFNASCESSDSTIPTRVLVAVGTPILAGLAFESATPYISDEIERRSAFAAAFERITRICHLTHGRVKPPADMIPHILQILVNALSASLSRRSNCFTDLKNQGFEPDMIQGFGEEIVEEESDLASDLVDAAGYLLKTDPSSVWQHFQSIVLPFMVGFLDLDTHGDAHLTHNALCCFVDALEFGQDDPRVGQACLPNLKKALFSSEAHLRQVAAYGLGICAQKLRGDDWVEDIGRSLIRVLNVKDAKEESMQMATENVASALGKLYLRTKNNDQLKAFLGQLPLQFDESEATFAHSLLFRLVLETGLTGFDATVVTTCAKILQHHTHSEEEIALSDEETFSRIPAVMSVVRNHVGKSGVEALIGGLSTEEIDDEVKAALAQM